MPRIDGRAGDVVGPLFPHRQHITIELRQGSFAPPQREQRALDPPPFLAIRFIMGDIDGGTGSVILAVCLDDLS